MKKNTIQLIVTAIIFVAVLFFAYLYEFEKGAIIGALLGLGGGPLGVIAGEVLGIAVQFIINAL